VNGRLESRPTCRLKAGATRSAGFQPAGWGTFLSPVSEVLSHPLLITPSVAIRHWEGQCPLRPDKLITCDWPEASGSRGFCAPTTEGVSLAPDLPCCAASSYAEVECRRGRHCAQRCIHAVKERGRLVRRIRAGCVRQIPSPKPERFSCKEERDRPGRSRRRPADGFEASETSPNCARVRRVRVFGGTPALPKATESFRKPTHSLVKGFRRFGRTRRPRSNCVVGLEFWRSTAWRRYARLTEKGYAGNKAVTFPW